MQSKWQQYSIEEKVIAILAEAQTQNPDHHFGRPYLSAYQLAIEFALRHPDDVAALGLPVGGAGIGESNSLAQYLAQQLSQRIHAKTLNDVDGAFLSDQHVRSMEFKDGEDGVRSSLAGFGIPLSMFRYKPLS